MVHFLKAVFESFFVHYYRRDYVNLSQSALEVCMCWGAFGFTFAFFVFHPYYTEPDWITDWTADQHHKIMCPIQFLCIIFAFAQLLSLLSNIHLSSVTLFRDQHPELVTSNNRLLIPTQHGFNKVSCANYFWLLLSWLMIAVASETLYSYMILMMLFFHFNGKAQKIHYNYVAKHRDMYPQGRRALIPYLF